MTYFDSSAGKFGEESDKQFNDYSGVDELVNLPHDAFHRNIDEIVLEAGKNTGVKTAIVCPPTIYGTYAISARRPRVGANETQAKDAALH